MRFMQNNTYPEYPLKPFSPIDYLLCTLSFLLSGIAFVPQLTHLLVSFSR